MERLQEQSLLRRDIQPGWKFKVDIWQKRRNCGFGLLPGTSTILDRLLSVKFFYKLHPKPEKVAQLETKIKKFHPPNLAIKNVPIHLSSSVDFSLPRILPLAQNGRCKELVPVLPADKIRRFQKDRRAIIPRHAFPFSLGSKRTVDRFRNRLFIRFLVDAENVRVVVG